MKQFGSDRDSHLLMAPVPLTGSRMSGNRASEFPVDIQVPEEEQRKVGCLWRLCCPCYYLFCCCCCCEEGMKITKTRFVYRFNKWINLKSKHLGGAMLDMSDPVYGLINLYAHKPGAIEDLKNCRVNPDFNSHVRNDLEFYIP